MMPDAATVICEADSDTGVLVSGLRASEQFYYRLAATLCCIAPLSILAFALALTHLPRAGQDAMHYAWPFSFVTAAFCAWHVAIGVVYLWLRGVFPLHRIVWLLRHAVVSADAASNNDAPITAALAAPEALAQPKPFFADEEQALPHTFTHIYWLENPRRGRQRISVVCVSLATVGSTFLTCALALYSSFVAVSPSPFAPPPISLFLIWAFFLYIVLVGIGAVGVYLFVMQRTPSLVHTFALGTEGLHLRRRFALRNKGQNIRSLAWNEIEHFACMSFHSSTHYHPQTLYLIETQAGIFAWGYEPLRQTALPEGGNSILTRLIATRTGLPLRDLTPLAYALATQIGGANGNSWRTRLALPQQHDMAAIVPDITPLRQALHPTTHERRITRWLITLSFVPGALYLLVAVIGLLSAGR